MIPQNKGWKFRNIFLKHAYSSRHAYLAACCIYHIFFTFYPAFLPALGIEIIFTKQRHITYVISVVGNPDGQKYISIMFSNRTVIMINVFVIWWCQYYRSHATSGLFTQFNEAKKFLKLHSLKFQILWEGQKIWKKIPHYFDIT